MKWQDKLTKAEKEHMREQKMRTKWDMEQNRKGQKGLDSAREVCWTCRSIAQKMGLE